MAQTPIILLATDHLLKGEGLAPSTAITGPLAECENLKTFVAVADATTGEIPEWASALEELPRETVLNNVQARLDRLLEQSEQGIRRFVSIFQGSSGASGMTTGTLDAAASLKNFKSFSDFGPNINNIQDLVTGGKTGSLPGGPEAMSKIGDSLKGLGTMFNPESLGDMGKSSALIKNLGSQNALPASVSSQIEELGIDLSNPGDGDEETLKKILAKTSPEELKTVGTVTGFPVDKLGNLGDALDPSKVLLPGAASSIPGGDISGLGEKLESLAGQGNFADIGKKLSGTKVPDLKHLMASPPDFSAVSDSLKDKFSTVSMPDMSTTDIPGASRAGLDKLNLPGGNFKFEVPNIAGHVPKMPNMPGVPSIPLEMPGFASGGAIDTSMYIRTPDEDLTYSGDDHIVWDRVNTERLNRGLPDLSALGTPRPEEPAPPVGATPNGTPGVYQMLGSLVSDGPLREPLEYLAQVSASLPDGPVDVGSVSSALAEIQLALDREEGALKSAGIDLKYPGPTGYVGVVAFAEKLHQYGVDKNNLGLDRFIEELATAADSAAGDSVIAALYEGKNLAT